jgi:hypothetical protein
MPYVAPTPAQFKARFPEFEAVADAIVAFAMEEAGLSVDDSWIERDYAIALNYLTAHILISSGRLSGDAAGAATLGPVISESLGDASVSYADKSKVVGAEGLAAELASTTYGQRFLSLRRRNFPTAIVC